MEPERPQGGRGMVKKKTKAGGITVLDLKLYNNALTLKTVRYWHRNGHIDQWNRIENPEMDPQFYGQLIFDNSGKNTQWKKDSLSNKYCGEHRTVTRKRMKVDHFLTPYTKINSKWMKGPNVDRTPSKS